MVPVVVFLAGGSPLHVVMFSLKLANSILTLMTIFFVVRGYYLAKISKVRATSLSLPSSFLCHQMLAKRDNFTRLNKTKNLARTYVP
jgi:hypothetical protein